MNPSSRKRKWSRDLCKDSFSSLLLWELKRQTRDPGQSVCVFVCMGVCVLGATLMLASCNTINLVHFLVTTQWEGWLCAVGPAKLKRKMGVFQALRVSSDWTCERCGAMPLTCPSDSHESSLYIKTSLSFCPSLGIPPRFLQWMLPSNQHQSPLWTVGQRLWLTHGRKQKDEGDSTSIKHSHKLTSLSERLAHFKLVSGMVFSLLSGSSIWLYYWNLGRGNEFPVLACLTRLCVLVWYFSKMLPCSLLSGACCLSGPIVLACLWSFTLASCLHPSVSAVLFHRVILSFMVAGFQPNSFYYFHLWIISNHKFLISLCGYLV